MRIVSTLIGILIMVYAISMTLFANFDMGTLMVFCLGLALALFFNVPKNRFTKALKVLAVTGYGIVFVMIGFIYVSGSGSWVTYDEDAVIVLGCSVIGDRISSPLRYRLDTAYEYYQKNPDALIVVSGGQGPQENLPEGEAMYNYLVERGIPSDSILVEDKATSTNENYRYSKEILDDYFKGQPYRCVYVTNRFHCYRAGRLAEINGLEAVGLGAPIGISAAIPSYMREVPAVFQLWIFNR